MLISYSISIAMGNDLAPFGCTTQGTKSSSSSGLSKLSNESNDNNNTSKEDEEKIEQIQLTLKDYNYELNTKCIGNGGFGTVYRCKREGSEQLLAVKVIENMDDQRNADAVKSEIMALKDLQHPNIISLIDSFGDDSDMYIILELGEIDLYQYSQFYHDGCVPETNIRIITLRVLEALNYVHEHGYIHSDLKPENILITDKNEVKLCDFGGARKVDLSEENIRFHGTRTFMAPEMLLLDPDYSKAVDIWSFGCLLSSLATGRFIFFGSSSLSQLDQIINLIGDLTIEQRNCFQTRPGFYDLEVPINIFGRGFRFRLSNVSSDLYWIISRCFEMDPSKRPSASALLNDCFYVLNGDTSMKSLIPLRRRNALNGIINEGFSDSDDFTDTVFSPWDGSINIVTDDELTKSQGRVEAAVNEESLENIEN